MASSPASLIQSLAPQYGIPPSLFLAVAQKESGLNQGAIGSKGEIGLFQLMPATAAQLGVDPADQLQNIQGAGTYLQLLYNQFGNWSDALEAYNGGASHVTAGTVSTAAQAYAASVLASAGITSDSADTSLLSNSSSVSDSLDSLDSLDLSTLLDPSQPSFYVALGLAAVVVYLIASR